MKLSRFQQLQRTNTFLHTNYFWYAKHKLKACEHLTAHIGDFSDTNLENKVCHELFYLMGYIIEGLSVYTIYEIIGWDKKVEISRPDPYIESEIGLSFDKKTKYTIRNHQFNSYLAVVRGKDEVRDIPFISGADSSNSSYALLKQWSPELRYDFNKITLTKKQIIELYNYCDKIYNAVVNYIGIPA